MSTNVDLLNIEKLESNYHNKVTSKSSLKDRFKKSLNGEFKNSRLSVLSNVKNTVNNESNLNNIIIPSSESLIKNSIQNKRLNSMFLEKTFKNITPAITPTESPNIPPPNPFQEDPLPRKVSDSVSSTNSNSMSVPLVETHCEASPTLSCTSNYPEHNISQSEIRESNNKKSTAFPFDMSKSSVDQTNAFTTTSLRTNLNSSYDPFKPSHSNTPLFAENFRVPSDNNDRSSSLVNNSYLLKSPHISSALKAQPTNHIVDNNKLRSARNLDIAADSSSSLQRQIDVIQNQLRVLVSQKTGSGGTPISNSTENRLSDIEERLFKIESLLSRNGFGNSQGQVLKFDSINSNNNQNQKLWISQLVQDGVSVVMYPFELIIYYLVSILTAIFGGFFNSNSSSNKRVHAASSSQRNLDPSFKNELTPTDYDLPNDMNINFSNMSQSRRKASRLVAQK